MVIILGRLIWPRRATHGAHGGKRTAEILTVDDDRAIQELYEAALSFAGHHICGQAFDGQRAIVMYGALLPRPEVLILDHRMPVLCGLDALRAIRAHDPDARVIFVSADTSVKEAALHAGARAFLAKPFALADLTALIARILSGLPAYDPGPLAPAAAPA